MVWANDEVDVLLIEALERDDLKEYRRLLQEYPENLRPSDGTAYHLSIAASFGKLPFVKLLVELGIDVNEPRNTDAPEGAICSAAREGHIEVVRWLLDQGARINCTVHGQVRCFALSNAAGQGHFDIVKLLVERGADLNASWAGMNALTQAEMYGHPEIADYLRSVGMTNVWENSPPDYSSAHQRLRDIIIDQHGKLARWKLDDEGDPAFSIFVTKPNRESNSQTLFTVGMSDRDLELPSGYQAAIELTLRLPVDWPLTKRALKEPRWNWPVEWMRKIAREALNSGQWPDDGAAIFMNGDPPQPLAADTRLCGWMCLLATTGQHQMPDHRWVDFRDLYAIYAEEAAMLKDDDYTSVIEKFYEREIPFVLDLKRENVAFEPE